MWTSCGGAAPLAHSPRGRSVWKRLGCSSAASRHRSLWINADQRQTRGAGIPYAVGAWRCLHAEPARDDGEARDEIREAARHPHHQTSQLLILERAETEERRLRVV